MSGLTETGQLKILTAIDELFRALCDSISHLPIHSEYPLAIRWFTVQGLWIYSIVNIYWLWISFTIAILHSLFSSFTARPPIHEHKYLQFLLRFSFSFFLSSSHHPSCTLLSHPWTYYGSQFKLYFLYIIFSQYMNDYSFQLLRNSLKHIQISLVYSSSVYTFSMDVPSYLYISGLESPRVHLTDLLCFSVTWWMTVWSTKLLTSKSLENGELTVDSRKLTSYFWFLLLILDALGLGSQDNQHSDPLMSQMLCWRLS